MCDSGQTRVNSQHRANLDGDSLVVNTHDSALLTAGLGVDADLPAVNSGQLIAVRASMAVEKRGVKRVKSGERWERVGKSGERGKESRMEYKCHVRNTKGTSENLDASRAICDRADGA